MTKIGVISDNHGSYESIEKALKIMGDIEYLFHLGDFLGKRDVLEKMTDAHLLMLLGNMDYRHNDGVDKLTIVIGGKMIFACHGHEYGVKISLDRLVYKGREEKADIILFGHTHIPYLEKTDETLIMNPGSLRYPFLAKGPSCGLITIEDDEIFGEILYF